jgi:hypothetical protein
MIDYEEKQNFSVENDNSSSPPPPEQFDTSKPGDAQPAPPAGPEKN